MLDDYSYTTCNDLIKIERQMLDLFQEIWERMQYVDNKCNYYYQAYLHWYDLCKTTSMQIEGVALKEIISWEMVEVTRSDLEETRIYNYNSLL